MTPGERLTLVMDLTNITQNELADLCKTTQTTIHRMQKDKQKLNFKVLSVLRIRYRVDINPFFDDSKQVLSGKI